MNQFNKLPPEIIEIIFKKVNSTDLINLSYVDKRFKQICEQFKIKQLCLSEFDDYNSFWFYTNDPIYIKKNVIEFSKFQNFATIFQLNQHLKRLILDIGSFDLSFLNQFKLLEQLSINLNKLNDNYKLSLNHLKIVDFGLEEKDECDFKLTFDTIQLFAFRISNELNKNLVFNYPNKILFFELDRIIDDWPKIYDYLKNFNNLKYFKLNGLCTRSMGRDIVSKFNNLEIIDLHMSSFYLRNDDGDDDKEEYDALVKDIKFLINDKKKSKKERSELEIYLNGVKLINQNEINLFVEWPSDKMQFESNLLEFQIKNYDLLKDNCKRCEINYCDLIKLIEIIPSSFTNKFPFIHEVYANDRIDEDQFIEFLNNLQYLSRLELLNCGLTKSFYDRLIDSIYLNDLNYLTIEEKDDLNFDFIFNLKQLIKFKTNQKINNHVDLIYKLFKQNQNIEKLQFKFDLKNYIEIYRCNSLFVIRSYYLDDDLEEVENFKIDDLKDLDDVISKLKELKF